MFCNSDQKKLQTGDVELVGRMEIGRREQCTDTAPNRIRAAAKQAHEKEEKKHAKESTNSGNQQAIAKLEGQLKAAKNENKRLAARVQQSGKARDAEVEPEDACDEEEAANLDELQTLVDLSSKYVPTRYTMRPCVPSLMPSERKSKMPSQSKLRSPTCRDGWRRRAKQLENEEASAAVLAVDIDELEKELQVPQRRAMLTGAATTACGERVFHLMLVSQPKQMEEKPEFMAMLDKVRASMAELFNMANEVPKTAMHDISSEADCNGQEMEDVGDDGYDCADGVDLGRMVDTLVGECRIDRDEAVKRLGVLLQRQSKRLRIYGETGQ